MDALYEKFKKFAVEAESLRDFCDRYHNYEYSETDYKMHKFDMEKDGYTIIDHWDSVTGEVVSYYGKI